MSKILAILGAGHLGQQIAHYAITDNHYDEVVFFDDFLYDNEMSDKKIIGTINDVEIAFQNNKFDKLLIGIGYRHLSLRRELFERFERKIPFGVLIHSSSYIDKTVILNKGVVIFPNCCIDMHSKIESNSILNISCTIAHDSKVGKHCFLSPSVAIAGFVEVEEQCIIGINSTIIDNIRIVSKTQIGAGSIVVNTILTSGLYVGNPAKLIK